MSLEDKVGNTKENRSLMRKALKTGYNLGVAGATTLLSTSFVGPTGVIIGGGIAAGTFIGHLVKKGRRLSSRIYEGFNDAVTNYSTINTIIYPVSKLWDVTSPLIPGTGLLNAAGKVAYAFTGFNAAFVGMFEGAKHLIKNYFNPSGTWPAIKENFYNKSTTIAKRFPVYLPFSLGITALPFPYFGLEKIPIFAANAPYVGYKGVTSPPPPYKADTIRWADPIYLGSGLASLGSKTVKGLYETIYSIGSVIGGAKPITPPATAPAPAAGGA